MQSLNIEPERPKNPYGPGGRHSQDTSFISAKMYFVICLALFTMMGIIKMAMPVDDINDEWAKKGGASGGWGAEHNHPVIDNGSGGSVNPPKQNSPPAQTYYPLKSQSSNIDQGLNDKEFRSDDLMNALAPIVALPAQPRSEYKMYQEAANFVPEDLLYDTNTPHGKAFDFILNRDKRKLSGDDKHLFQRFVLTLIFYAWGELMRMIQKNITLLRMPEVGGRLHECHWVKKSLEDHFWGILSIESESDQRVGVTKCNNDMEVIELRLADLNLVGPVPSALGDLDELRYLSLDGNNFSGSIPDVFTGLTNLERVYLNFNEFNGVMPSSLCFLREEGVLEDLWSDCGGYPITCTCCTVCCDMVAECDEMASQQGGSD
ncbi:hypothetical protein QTG54_004041 [Skeletonema marinoi]|uniref:Uncharacterized protein n=1 Tax=Skeletonema marinoi TaxID=267567 RepID=A0AAD9DG89_9STRA|nr:hypothetical protein QTG54_004041 [Skeletonema marinoi]